MQVEARHVSGDLAIASRHIDELVRRGAAAIGLPESFPQCHHWLRAQAKKR